MAKLSYDPEADCAYLRIGGRDKVYESIEFNDNIVLDLKRTGGLAGVEVIDVAGLISSILNKKFSREYISKHLTGTIGREDEGAVRVDLQLQNQHIVYNIPKSYTSPLLTFSR